MAKLKSDDKWPSDQLEYFIKLSFVENMSNGALLFLDGNSEYQDLTHEQEKVLSRVLRERNIKLKVTSVY